MTVHAASRRSAVSAGGVLFAAAVVLGGAVPFMARADETSVMAGAGVVFTADEQGNSVSVVDLGTGTVATTVISVSPHNVQASSDGTMIFVVGSVAGASHAMPAAMAGPGKLLLFAAASVSRGPVAEIEVGRMPAHVVVNGSGTRAFVTNGGDNTLAVVDLAQRQVVKSVAVGASPHVCG